jgi:hypothetical protein
MTRSTVAAACATALLAAATGRCALASAAAYPPGMHRATDRPHPAVCRVIVPEAGATAFGSGTLVDVRDQFGLVVTNWHVVRDAQGEVEVVFPDGFRSKGRALKVDADWDLAAVVIWRPPAAPAPIAPLAPQPGDELTICGYGQGQYRAATGRCTQYYAPKLALPQHMVELDVEARQGDSGGPIFNDRGELAGVLFGAGGGTTLGSFGGRVQSFLATLAPDIGRPDKSAFAKSEAAPPANDVVRKEPSAQLAAAPVESPPEQPEPEAQPATLWTQADDSHAPVDKAAWETTPGQPSVVAASPQRAPAPRPSGWLEHSKNLLAAIGVIAILVQVLRAAR